MNKMKTNVKSKISSADVVLVGALIAAGAVLRLFCPPIFGITPNFVIGMYCVAILIIRPTFRQTIGIGLVAGAVCNFTTKAMIPYLNFISEPIGAVVAYLIVIGLENVRISKFSFKPFVVTLFGTLASGLTFVTALKAAILFANSPKNPALLGLLSVVVVTALINAVFAQAVYYPIMAASGKKIPLVQNKGCEENHD